MISRFTSGASTRASAGLSSSRTSRTTASSKSASSGLTSSAVTAAGPRWAGYPASAITEPTSVGSSRSSRFKNGCSVEASVIRWLPAARRWRSDSAPGCMVVPFPQQDFLAALRDHAEGAGRFAMPQLRGRGCPAEPHALQQLDRAVFANRMCDPLGQFIAACLASAVRRVLRRDGPLNASSHQKPVPARPFTGIAESSNYSGESF